MDIKDYWMLLFYMCTLFPGMIILFLATMPLFAVYINGQRILVLLGQDPLISQWVGIQLHNLKSPATQLFINSLLNLTTTKPPKVCITVPMGGEFNGIPLTRNQ